MAGQIMLFRLANSVCLQTKLTLVCRNEIAEYLGYVAAPRIEATGANVTIDAAVDADTPMAPMFRPDR